VLINRQYYIHISLPSYFTFTTMQAMYASQNYQVIYATILQ